jgi:hypothetical protein
MHLAPSGHRTATIGFVPIPGPLSTDPMDPIWTRDI